MTDQDSAKSTEEEFMVLRQTHLRKEVDDLIRGLAHTLGVSKADVIRYCISTGLKEVKEKLGADWAQWTPEQREHLMSKVNGTND